MTPSQHAALAKAIRDFLTKNYVSIEDEDSRRGVIIGQWAIH
jgi:hypothetical protein